MTDKRWEGSRLLLAQPIDMDYFMTTQPYIIDNDDLRAPQRIAYERVYSHFRMENKTDHAIVVLPTGVGKTGLMGLLPYGICAGRVLILTPQLVIKDNVVDSLNPEYPENFWLKRNVLDAESLPCLVEFDSNRTSDEVLEMANIVVVNIHKCQTRLSSSLLHRVAKDFFDMILVDEAHHSPAATWQDTLNYFARAKVVKLTGTPYRSDSQHIEGELVWHYRLSMAMANDYVKQLEQFSYVPDDLRFTVDNNPNAIYGLDEILEIKDSDWVARSVAYSEECSERIVLRSIELLRDKIRRGRGLPHKIIAVACSIAHATQIRDIYEKHGCHAVLVHSELSEDEKEHALSDVENDRASVVVHVAMLGEGYDHPYLSVAAIFRPFRNMLPYSQFIGRVLRRIPSEDNPKPCDNIADVVCHQCLYLNSLWEEYKQEIQEAEIIRRLSDIQLDDELVDETTLCTDTPSALPDTHRDMSHGTVTEGKSGSMIRDPFLRAEAIEQRKREQEDELQKIKSIQTTLGITHDEAQRLVFQALSRNQSLKRPDLYISRRKADLNDRIVQDIVPMLVEKYGIDINGNNIAKCSALFGGRHAWIPDRHPKNGAMLAVYINTCLKNHIGAPRDKWLLTDWDAADAYLEWIVRYIEQSLGNYLQNP